MAPSVPPSSLRSKALAGAALTWLGACVPNSRLSPSTDSGSVPAAPDIAADAAASVGYDEHDAAAREVPSDAFDALGDEAAPEAWPADAGSTSRSTVGPLAHDPASVAAFLCEGRPQCHVERVYALPPRAGTSRTAVRVRIGEATPFPQEVRYELWLVEAPLGERLSRRFLIATHGMRPDDGTPGMELSLAGNRLHYHFNTYWERYASFWGGAYDADLTLDPPHVVAHSHAGFHELAPCQIERWSSRAGVLPSSVAWSRQSCGGRFDGARRTALGADGTATVCRDFAFDSIPDAQLDSIDTAGAWRTTTLGGCSLVVDGTPSHGFVVSGRPSGREDSSFRVVLSGRVLLLEIRDDVFTAPGPAQKAFDRVEIWLGDSADSYTSWCGRSDGETEEVRRAALLPQHWSFAVAGDSPPEGSPADAGVPRMERWRADDHIMRVRIELPAFEAITVGYGDSDDGLTEKSLLATSRLIVGDGSTLGRADPTKASCVVRDGALQAVFPDESDPLRPLVGQ